MPHVLIAGTSGSGKSVLLNDMICSILMRQSPSKVNFVMIDPKQVELSMYKGLPHLACPIITDVNMAVLYLKGITNLIKERYTLMEKNHAKKANDLGLQSVVIVIDELADLMITSKYECENSIIRIAQIGRAAGVHLIIATQRPTTNVLTGLIKSNIACRIALQTTSIRDSINILDHKGAESLIGRGDAIIKMPDSTAEYRFQAPYISDDDINNIVNYWKYDAKVYVDKNGNVINKK